MNRDVDPSLQPIGRLICGESYNPQTASDAERLVVGRIQDRQRLAARLRDIFPDLAACFDRRSAADIAAFELQRTRGKA